MIDEWDTFDFTPFVDAIVEFEKEMTAGRQVKVVKPVDVEDDEEESPEELYEG